MKRPQVVVASLQEPTARMRSFRFAKSRKTCLNNHSMMALPFVDSGLQEIRTRYERSMLSTGCMTTIDKARLTLALKMGGDCLDHCSEWWLGFLAYVSTGRHLIRKSIRIINSRNKDEAQDLVCTATYKC